MAAEIPLYRSISQSGILISKENVHDVTYNIRYKAGGRSYNIEGVNPEEVKIKVLKTKLCIPLFVSILTYALVAGVVSIILWQVRLSPSVISWWISLVSIYFIIGLFILLILAMYLLMFGKINTAVELRVGGNSMVIDTELLKTGINDFKSVLEGKNLIEYQI